MPSSVGKKSSVHHTTGAAAPAAKKKATAKKSLDAPKSTKVGGLVSTAPAAKKKVTGDLDKLAAADKAHGVKVVDIVKKPTHVTSISAKFTFGGYEGRKLDPGQEILMLLPEHLRDRPVRNVILVHRKDSAHDSNNYTGEHDNSPALTAVHVHSKDLPAKEAWRQWDGPWGASGSEGAKFAEKRGAGDPEFETEFNWPENGHSGVYEGYGTTDLLYGDAARVKALGDDPSFVHSVEIQVAPRKPDEVIEKMFSPGTSLGDPETLVGHKFGGGQAHGGKFPGALELSGWGASSVKLPEGWSMSGGELTIDVKPGRKITGVDIACGDTHPDGASNKDGGTGTLGWSRLSIGLRRADGSTDWFMSKQGVPPEGILTGAPSDVGYKTKAGDKIVISASSDTTYVMGVRVGLEKP